MDMRAMDELHGAPEVGLGDGNVPGEGGRPRVFLNAFKVWAGWKGLRATPTQWGGPDRGSNQTPQKKKTDRKREIAKTKPKESIVQKQN